MNECKIKQIIDTYERVSWWSEIIFYDHLIAIVTIIEMCAVHVRKFSCFSCKNRQLQIASIKYGFIYGNTSIQSRYDYRTEWINKVHFYACIKSVKRKRTILMTIVIIRFHSTTPHFFFSSRTIQHRNTPIPYLIRAAIEIFIFILWKKWNNRRKKKRNMDRI